MRRLAMLLALVALWAGAEGCKKKEKPAGAEQEQTDQPEAEADEQELTPEEMEVVEEE